MNRTVVAEDARLRIKTANSDKEFEQALADLSYTQLSSRAPKLFRYAVAFQVIDQSDDGDRATGVFIFKAGDNWFQVPVFYKDGEIRGTEILALGEDDYFPLTEESVNFFLENRATGRSGKPISKQETARYVSPSLWQLNTPPTKWSSARDLNLPKEALNLRGVARAVRGIYVEPTGLPKLVEEVARSPKLAAALGRFIGRAPLLAEKLAGVLDLPALAAAVQAHKTAAAAPAGPPALLKPGRRLASKTAASLTVIRATTSTLTRIPLLSGYNGLSNDERDKVLAGRPAYRDGRPDSWCTHVVDWGNVGSPGVAQNPPAGAGIYTLPCGEDQPERCLVVSAPADPEYGNLEDHCLVLRISDGACAVLPRADVWVHGHEPDGMREWFEGLGEAGDPENLPQKFVLVSPNGQVTRPLVKIGPVSGMMGVEVGCYPSEFDPPGWYTPSVRKFYSGAPPWDEGGFRDGRFDRGEERLLRRERMRPRRVARTHVRAGDFVATGNCLYYPDGTKVYPLPNRPKPIPLMGWNAAEDPTVTRVKSAARKEGHARLGLTRNLIGGGYTTEFAPHAEPARSSYAKTLADAEADLVEVYGLRPADAEKLAAKAASEVVEVVVKVAQPIPPLNNDRGVTAPEFPFDFGQMTGGEFDDVVPTAFHGDARIGVASAMPTQSDWDRYRKYPFDQGLQVDPMRIGNEPPPGPESDPQVLALLNQAAQTGEKNIADVGTLASLVKYTDIDDSLARLLGPMRKFISRLGATLINAYANPDAYEERYGRMEMVDLIDRLRGQFVGLGELYLSLREKASDRVLTTSSVLPDLDISAQGQTND